MTPLKVPPLQFYRIPATDEFITRNRLTLQAQNSIAAKARQIADNFDKIFLESRLEVLIEYLAYPDAKLYLENDIVAEFEAGTKVFPEPIIDIREAAQDFLDYLNFAWGKAIDQRGLSAYRSINKLSAWLWLLGRPDLEALIQEDRLYNPYGAPALIEISAILGLPVPDELLAMAN